MAVETLSKEDEALLREARANGTIKMISVSALAEDVDNREIYGSYDIEGLAESIKEHGFQGVIRAYPYVHGHYTHRIESGHRSLEAAKAAGLTEVPVIVTSSPSNEIERRKRLVLANLHGRVYTPLRMAKQAEYLIDTYRMENSTSSTSDILDKVAADLECSKANLGKYRQLLQLIPSLQELADSGTVSWSALAPASSLSDNQQKQLSARIRSQIRVSPSGVTRDWIANEIDEYRYIKEVPGQRSFDPRYILGRDSEFYKEDSDTTSASSADADGTKRKRRCDGAKAIRKSKESLELGLSKDAVIKGKARLSVIKDLMDMRDLINQSLDELLEK